ncbi:MAG TPA: glucose-6-phosphate isomerase family protein, partial [Bacillota bacterium]|nr:glucose-6-phosphate isomerase family protein [Bacillota bacterium]
MIDLHKQSGLPMLWDPAAKQIVFKEEAAGNSAPAPDVRRRRDIVEVLYDRRSADMDELYYMYRGVALEDDRRLIKEKGLRYDITVIVPGTLGLEYV